MELIISGEKLDPIVKEKIAEWFEELATHKFGYKSLRLHIKGYHETGLRKKYSISAHADTEVGAFVADAHSWILKMAIKKIIQKLQKQIHNYLKKRRGD